MICKKVKKKLKGGSWTNKVAIKIKSVTDDEAESIADMKLICVNESGRKKFPLNPSRSNVKSDVVSADVGTTQNAKYNENLQTSKDMQSPENKEYVTDTSGKEPREKKDDAKVNMVAMSTT